MKSRSIQFGLRENTASSRRHDSRLATHSAEAHSTSSAPEQQQNSLAPPALPTDQSPMLSPDHAAQGAATGERDSSDAPLLSIRQAAHLLAVSVSTLYGWVWQRKIPFVKIGRALRFDRKDLAEFVRVNKHAPWHDAAVKQECQSCYNTHAAGKR